MKVGPEQHVDGVLLEGVGLGPHDDPDFVVGAVHGRIVAPGKTARRRVRARRECRHDVARGESAAVESADARGQVGGPAAHDHGHVDAASDRQICPHAVLHVPEAQLAVLRDVDRLPAGQRGAVQRSGEVAPGDGNTGVPQKAGRRAQHRHLEARGALVVADQQVGRTERELVHRARYRDAEALVAVAAPVLHGGEQAGRQYLQRRAAHEEATAGNSWPPAAGTGTNLTRSPAPSSDGGSRSASNSANGVRPMIRQPPGLRTG